MINFHEAPERRRIELMKAAIVHCRPLDGGHAPAGDVYSFLYGWTQHPRFKRLADAVPLVPAA